MVSISGGLAHIYNSADICQMNDRGASTYGGVDGQQLFSKSSLCGERDRENENYNTGR